MKKTAGRRKKGSEEEVAAVLEQVCKALEKSKLGGLFSEVVMVRGGNEPVKRRKLNPSKADLGGGSIVR